MKFSMDAVKKLSVQRIALSLGAFASEIRCSCSEKEQKQGI
jgi:hypothetical protein